MFSNVDGGFFLAPPFREIRWLEVMREREWFLCGIGVGFRLRVLVCDNFNVGLLKKAHGECKLKCIYAHKSSFLNIVINLVIY